MGARRRLGAQRWSAGLIWQIMGKPEDEKMSVCRSFVVTPPASQPLINTGELHAAPLSAETDVQTLLSLHRGWRRRRRMGRVGWTGVRISSPARSQ